MKDKSILVSILVLVDLAHESTLTQTSGSITLVSILVLVDLAHEFFKGVRLGYRGLRVSILVLVDLAHEFFAKSKRKS